MTDDAMTAHDQAAQELLDLYARVTELQERADDDPDGRERAAEAHHRLMIATQDFATAFYPDPPDGNDVSGLVYVAAAPGFGPMVVLQPPGDDDPAVPVWPGTAEAHAALHLDQFARAEALAEARESGRYAADARDLITSYLSLGLLRWEAGPAAGPADRLQVHLATIELARKLEVFQDLWHQAEARRGQFVYIREAPPGAVDVALWVPGEPPRTLWPPEQPPATRWSPDDPWGADPWDDA